MESTVITRHLRWRREQFGVQSGGVVEGWIGGDWTCSGVTLKGHAGEESEVVRLKNAGAFTQFLLMYDGIDSIMDTGWLDGVVPRVAEVLGLRWRIVDYTVTLAEIAREGGLLLSPGTSGS